MSSNGFAAPVVANVFREFLAIAGGAARVRHDDQVTRGREHLRVPAIGPAFAPVAFRTAVDQKQNRVFLIRLEVRRLHHEALRRVLSAASTQKSSSGVERALRQQSIVQMRERDGRAAAGTGAINLRWRGTASAGVDHGFAVAGELHVVQRAGAADNHAGGAAGGRDHLDALASAILHGEEQRVRIGRPGEAFDRADRANR